MVFKKLEAGLSDTEFVQNLKFVLQVYQIFEAILCCMTPQKSISSCGQSIRSAVQKQLEKVSITSNNRSWLIHIKNDSNMATEIDW